MQKLKYIPLVLALTFSVSYSKDLGDYGQTFSISEENIVEMIKHKLQGMQDSGQLSKIEEEAKKRVYKSATEPTVVGLETTISPEIYFYTPIFTLQEDLKDSNGRLIYPKGTTINPLDSSTYPNKLGDVYKFDYKTKLVFFNGSDNKQINLVSKLIKQYKDKGQKFKLIMTGGNISDTSKYLKQRTYFDQHGLITTKMGVKHVPTVASVDGSHFEIKEYSVYHESDKLKGVDNA